MNDNYYHTKKSAEEYIKMAEGFDGRKLIEKLLNYLPKGSTVLELGMGPGTDLEILADYYQATGSDFSSVFLDRYRKINPKSDLLELNAISLETERKFDGIYSNKVLHHLTNDELTESISNQWRILNEGGIICHSFWKGRGEAFFSGLLFNKHAQKELEKIFSGLFEILLIEVYTEMEEEDSIVLIGRKK